MARYDGSVRINTDVSTRNAQVQLAALENRIVKTADKISGLRSKMDALKDAKVPTQEYQEVSAQIEKAEQSLNGLLAKQEQMQREGKDHGVAWQRINDKITEVRNEISYAKGELQDLVDTGKAFTLGQDTEEYAKLGQQIQYAENDLAVLTQKHDILNDKLQRADGYKKLANVAKSAFDSIGRILKKANSAVNAFGKRLKEIAQKHLPFFRKETERTKSSLSGFGARLKSIALSLLIFNQISKIFRVATSGIKEGFSNLYEENERFKNSIDSLKASLLTLKNALAGAFAPIVEIAIPYIQKLTDCLVDAVNLIGQFIAALTGRKTYTKAIKQTAAAFEDAAEATEDETEALNKQLSPLDRLNNLSSQKDKDKDDNKNSGTSSGTGTMFEEVPIDSSILDMANKVKDILSKLFAPLKEAWNREGKFVMDSWKYALDEVWKLIKDIGRDFLTVWQQEKTIKIFEDILHIIGDIGLVVGHLARNFRDAWNENETGLHILENIRDIIGAIIHNIRLAADKTVEWADKLNFKPLLEAFERFTKSLIPVTDNLSGILTDFYTQVLLPLAKWTIEKGLPELLDVFTAFNDRVDWEALRNNLSEFWDHLEPFAETVGEGLIIFIERVSDAIANFINSETFVNFLHTVEDWMDSVTPEDVAKGIERLVETLIGLKLAFLGFQAISAVTGVLKTIKDFLSFFGIGGTGATVAEGIEETTTALGGLAGALTDFGLATAGATAVGNVMIDKTLELAEANGVAAQEIENVKEEYGSFIGPWKLVKDELKGVTLGLQGLPSTIPGVVGAADALDKAMSSIAEGTIYTDEQMKKMQETWNLTTDDMEMLRQEMLDVNPTLREIADNLGFENASAETLQDIAEGFASISNGIQPLPEEMFNMTEEARNFINEVRNSEEPLQIYGDKLSGIGTEAENASGKVNFAAQNIAKGISENMETVSTTVDTSLRNMNSNWENMWNSLPGATSAAINIAKGSLKSFEQEVIEMLRNISNSIASIGSNIASNALRSGGKSYSYGRSYSAATPYSVHPAIAALQNAEIPGYATGQVIPRTMKEHLAILGDNSQETEIVSPLSTMKQAVKEAIAEAGITSRDNNGGGNTYEFSVDGQVFFRIMEKYADEYKKQHGGKPAFG